MLTYSWLSDIIFGGVCNLFVSTSRIHLIRFSFMRVNDKLLQSSCYLMSNVDWEITLYSILRAEITVYIVL